MIYESSNAFSFPHSSRNFEKVFLNTEQLKTPEVGKYTKNIIIEPKGGYHFNKEEKFKVDRPKTPGPGKYNVNNEIFGKYTPKFSKAKRITNIGIYKKKSIPGPGAYTITEENYEKTVGRKKIFVRFSKAPRLRIRINKVPGVGKYELSYYDLGKSTKNKYTIPKSKREMYLKKEYSNEKEGKMRTMTKYYTLKPFFGNEGTKPLLRGKPKDNKSIDYNVGPGQYDIEKALRKTLTKSPIPSIGYEKRIICEEIAKKNTIPGPKYNIPSEFDITNKSKIHGIKYIKKKKTRKNDKRYQTPGPGSYRIPCSFANTPLYQSIRNKYRKI